MENGHYNSHVRAMRKLYAGRRVALLAALDQHLGEMVTALRPEGGLQIPCLLVAGWAEEKSIRQAAATGVQLAGLSRLYAAEDKREWWILSYASLTGYEIETAVQHLATVLRK